MNKSSTLFAGPTGPSGDRPGPDKVIGIIITYFFIALFFPVLAVAYGIWLALFTYARLPWWIPAPAVGILTLTNIAFGTLSPNGVSKVFGSLGTAFSSLFSKHHSFVSVVYHLIATQALFSLWASTTAAMLVIAFKWQKFPRWQEQHLNPGMVLKKRFKKTQLAIEGGYDSPEDSITIGISKDLRDPRFAGGKPGTPYGERVKISNQEGAGHLLVVGGSGSGKALDINTLIPTPNGFIKMGELKVGDSVFGSNGSPVKVIGAYDTVERHDCFEVEFSDGSKIIADAEHLWTVETTATRKSFNRSRKNDIRVPVGKENEILSVEMAYANADKNILVPSSDLIKLLDRAHATSLICNIIKNITPAGLVKVGPYNYKYEDKVVSRYKTVNGWAPDEVYPAVLNRLKGFWHDQREISNNEPITLTTREMSNSFRNKNRDACEYSIKLAGVIQYPERKNLLLDPYLLGLHLGDGGTSGASYTTADIELVEAWKSKNFDIIKLSGKDPYSYYTRGFQTIMKELNIFGNKHIPQEYLISSESQRRALLAGLLDTDGCHEGGPRVSFCNKVERLADEFLELAASLGYRPTKTKRYVNMKDGRRLGPYFNISFQAMDDVFRLQRKNDSHRKERVSGVPTKQNHRYIKNIKQVESVPVRCIAVDAPDRLFLAGKTFIATHNTRTMLVGMRDVIRLGRGLIVIDCKGGPDIPLALAEWAERYDREFFHWSIRDPKMPYNGPASGPAFYDPISRGDASRRKDLLIGSQKWDVEFYKNVVANYLQTAFAVMDLVPPLEGVDTFADLSDLLSPSQLLKRSKYIVAEENAELKLALNRIPDIESQALSGINAMYSRIQTLTSSTAGAWLRKDPDGVRDIDFRKVADEGQVVVFSLDSSNYEDTVNLIAGLIIQDLKTLSSELRTEPADLPLHIYIDEFSSIDTTNILGLLAKARDAKMPVTLATQALADLQRNESTFVHQVLGIVTSFIIHRANAEADARIYAGLSGVVKKRFEKVSMHNSNVGVDALGNNLGTGTRSSEEREDYAIAVGVFQHLPLGNCVYITKSPTVRYVNPIQVIIENEYTAVFKADKAVEVERRIRSEKSLVSKKIYPNPATVEANRFNSPKPIVQVVENNNIEQEKVAGPKRPSKKPVVPGKAAGTPIPLPVLSPNSELAKTLPTPMPTIVPPVPTKIVELGSKASDDWMMP